MKSDRRLTLITAVVFTFVAVSGVIAYLAAVDARNARDDALAAEQTIRQITLGIEQLRKTSVTAQRSGRESDSSLSHWYQIGSGIGFEESQITDVTNYPVRAIENSEYGRKDVRIVVSDASIAQICAFLFASCNEQSGFKPTSVFLQAKGHKTSAEVWRADLILTRLMYNAKNRF